jgi:osmotically-inducible protein OsmY
MRTNADIQRDVTTELHWDPLTRDCEIAVIADDGVVTLGGTVSSYPAKYAASRAAERVAGVRAVADDIGVLLSTTDARSDTEVAHQVVNALHWDMLVPDDQLKSRVQDGWITLEGEVLWDYQRRAAFRAVRNLQGVKGVTNLITVKAQPAEKDVSSRIKSALHRRAELESQKIDVDVEDGVVTLKGTVHSWAQRHDAERAAWAAPGVRQVKDQLLVLS